MGTKFSARPDRLWGPPSLLYDGCRGFSGSKVRPERAADHSPLLVPQSWKSRAIPIPLFSAEKRSRAVVHRVKVESSEASGGEL